MAQSKHPELAHWHTSEITFGSALAAKNCLEALTAVVCCPINVHGNGEKVSFEGYFDFNKFEMYDEVFSTIVANFCLAECKYAVKHIFNDADGYFGGWTMVFAGSGEVLKSCSLSEVFESNY